MLLNLVLCLIFYFIPGGHLEIITNYADSIAGMKSLVDMEGLFIRELTNYTQALKDKINNIESFLEAVQVKREFSRRNPTEFVAHPLNTFALIRRLHEDWSFLELYMSEKKGESHLQVIQEALNKGQPSEQDMMNAFKGMLTVTQFYDQEPVDVAKGILFGHQYNVNMTTLECLKIAHICEESGYNKYVSSWYKAALQQYDELRDGEVFREVWDFKLNGLYNNLSTALTKEGFVKLAVKLLRDVSDLDADLWYAQRKFRDIYKIDWKDPIVVPIDLDIEIECAGNWPDAVQNLYCYYEKELSAFLTIAPLKTEILHKDQHILLYHDVIYDTEISRMKNISIPNLKTPPKSYLNGEYQNFKYTTIYEEEQSRLNYRIRDMTGSEVKEDKGFEIYNYGIGGLLDPHYDNLEIEDQTLGLGDRHTSIVFFLNSVTDGGAITFPDLQLTVFPQKGSALVWNNLDNALQPNKLMHTSCPVIFGSKWTLVKWLHEGPQVFAKPCMEERKAATVSGAKRA